MKAIHLKQNGLHYPDANLKESDAVGVKSITPTVIHSNLIHSLLAICNNSISISMLELAQSLFRNDAMRGQLLLTLMSIHSSVTQYVARIFFHRLPSAFVLDSFTAFKRRF